MSERITVNDGKGLVDSAGMVDLLIIDCNALPKLLVEGRYVGFCAKIVEMVQKLTNLKAGIKADLEDREASIRELRKTNDDLMEQFGGLPVDRGDQRGDA